MLEKLAKKAKTSLNKIQRGLGNKPWVLDSSDLSVCTPTDKCGVSRIIVAGMNELVDPNLITLEVAEYLAAVSPNTVLKLLREHKAMKEQLIEDEMLIEDNGNLRWTASGDKL